MQVVANFLTRQLRVVVCAFVLGELLTVVHLVKIQKSKSGRFRFVLLKVLEQGGKLHQIFPNLSRQQGTEQEKRKEECSDCFLHCELQN